MPLLVSSCTYLLLNLLLLSSDFKIFTYGTDLSTLPFSLFVSWAVCSDDQCLCMRDWLASVVWQRSRTPAVTVVHLTHTPSIQNISGYTCSWCRGEFMHVCTYSHKMCSAHTHTHTHRLIAVQWVVGWHKQIGPASHFSEEWPFISLTSLWDRHT